MSVWVIIGIVVSTACIMEFVAWATHKYVMHGFLWRLHSDHHRKDPYSFLERNDTFFLIFAAPSMTFFIIGSQLGLHTPWLWIGLGILIYGVLYFFVHEVFIHQRIKWLRRTNNAYFMALRKAHKVHHKKLDREDGECFGMLVVPMKYFKEAKQALRSDVAKA